LLKRAIIAASALRVEWKGHIYGKGKLCGQDEIGSPGARGGIVDLGVLRPIAACHPEPGDRSGA
jgi:hypothetical protein